MRIVKAESGDIFDLNKTGPVVFWGEKLFFRILSGERIKFFHMHHNLYDFEVAVFDKPDTALYQLESYEKTRPAYVFINRLECIEYYEDY